MTTPTAAAPYWNNGAVKSGKPLRKARYSKTAPIVAQAGADVLVAGSAVFKGGSVSDPAPYGTNIRAIREAAAGVYV